MRQLCYTICMNRFLLYAIIFVFIALLVGVVIIFRSTLTGALYDSTTGELFFSPSFEERSKKEQLDLLLRDNQSGMSEEEREQRIQVLDSLRQDAPGTFDPNATREELVDSSGTSSTQADTQEQLQANPQSGARNQADLERLKLLDQMAQ